LGGISLKIKKIKKSFNWLLLFSNIFLLASFIISIIFSESGKISAYVLNWRTGEPGFKEFILYATIFLPFAILTNCIISLFRARIPAYVLSAVIIITAGLNFAYNIIATIASGVLVILGANFYFLIGGLVLMVISYFPYTEEDKKIKEYNKLIKTQHIQPQEEELRESPEPPAKKKLFVKSLFIAFCIALAAVLAPLIINSAILNAAEKETEEKQNRILEEYTIYSKVETDENKSGLYISIGSFNSIDIIFSNPEISQSKNNVEASAGRVYVLDAETREDAPHQVMFSTVTTTITGAPAAVTYQLSVRLTETISKPRFILVCFNGISSEEAAEFETPPLFYIIRLNADGSCEILTASALKMESLFKEGS